MFGIGKKYGIDDLNILSELPLSTLRERAKILVIDDEPLNQIEPLRRSGFNIKKFDDVEDINHVSSYDIILCDIMGVGRKFSERLQGAYVINEIHRLYPEKYLIAYSAQTTDMSLNKYFNFCDDVFKKDDDVAEWSEKLEQAVHSCSDPKDKWRKLHIRLVEEGIPSSTITKLENHYVRKLLGKRNKFEKVCRDVELPDSIKTIALNLVSSAAYAMMTTA